VTPDRKPGQVWAMKGRPGVYLLLAAEWTKHGDSAWSCVALEGQHGEVEGVAMVCDDMWFDLGLAEVIACAT